MEVSLSIAIPSFRRGEIALASIRALSALERKADEILLVDQTQDHPPDVVEALQALHDAGTIRWLRLSEPSIPHAMNVGLLQARSEVVLFLDDDMVPDARLVAVHAEAQAQAPGLVAGQVLQPDQKPEPLRSGEPFRFNSIAPADIREFMGGNFSVNRKMALELGGFDENFVGAAYRFEAEFAYRWLHSFEVIRFEPAASIHHLAIPTGGTRAHGHHLRTVKPTHAVGAYYYWLCTRNPGWRRQALLRPLRAVRTRHHLRRPWWIPLTLLAELRGFLMALQLNRKGPSLVHTVSGARHG
ncbi:MAG: glycosyltransferase family 2 protein [Xanthomonadales bacterium PRO6]|nr:hypothetical protein [Xanthomonadales bacterium]MCE7930738.1 glycosyltransferase family 2 protein [Xanthomonadales bacterium PRO6]